MKRSKLPKFLQDKQCCVNMQNDDDKCFIWCVLRALHPVKSHKERISDLKEYISEFDTSMLTFL
jgi:hypothetical protein